MSLTTDPTNPCLRKIKEDGQQACYLVLSEEERAKGFVRPVRHSYIHLKCGGETHMGLALCETYSRNPRFYTGTFCCVCGAHFHLKKLEQIGINPDGSKKWSNDLVWQFEWLPDGDPVGSNAEEAELYLAEKKKKENEKHLGSNI